MVSKKEGTVAPKERVNIVYKPATGDQEEAIELSHRQLIIGDFKGSEDPGRIEERKPVDVNKKNLDEVLKGQDVKLNMEVPNKLSEDPEAVLNLEMKFEKMSDFEPEAVAEKIPEINKLLKLRNALQALKGPLSNVPEFRKKIQELIKDDEQRKLLIKELGL